jgi:hypothetical protein
MIEAETEETYETNDEFKQGIREFIDNPDDLDEIESIFQKDIATATDLYYLVDQHDFFVMGKTDCGDGTYRCLIECDNDMATETVRRILSRYTECQGVQVAQMDREFLVSQIPERSYFYLALFKGTVVKWVYRLRKLIPNAL